MASEHAELTQVDRARDRARFWEIHDKDEYVCPDCRRSRADKDLEFHVHHIDGEPGKVVGLCLACHWVRHGAEARSVDVEFWKDGFLDLGEDSVNV